MVFFRCWWQGRPGSRPTVEGGLNNLAGELYSVGLEAHVSGRKYNRAKGAAASVLGGTNNLASNVHTIQGPWPRRSG